MKLQHAHGEKFECESFGKLDNEAIIDKINNIKGRRAKWDLKQKKCVRRSKFNDFEYFIYNCDIKLLLLFFYSHGKHASAIRCEIFLHAKKQIKWKSNFSFISRLWFAQRPEKFDSKNLHTYVPSSHTKTSAFGLVC